MKEKLNNFFAELCGVLVRPFMLAIILAFVAFVPYFIIDRYGMWMWLIPATWGAFFNPTMIFLQQLLGEIYGRPKI